MCKTKILPIGAEVVLTVVELVVPTVVVMVVVVVEVRLNIALLGLNKVRLNKLEILNDVLSSISSSNSVVTSILGVVVLGFLGLFLSKAGILMSGNLAMGRKNGGRAFLGGLLVVLVIVVVASDSVVVVVSGVVKIGILGNLGRI